MRFSKETGYLCAMIWAVMLASCSTPKNVAYFQDVTDNARIIESARELRIEPLDKLQIVVKTKDDKLSQMFNKTLPYDRVGDGFSDYTVTAGGMVDMPVIGEIKIAGMTRGEAAAFIKGELMGRGYVKDPVVTVEMLNAGYSILGEVNTPGRKEIEHDLMTLPEAIAAGGDLTLQGQRENVRVIRREGESVQTYVVDLTKFSNLAESPAYYVKQGDVIYVEPNKVQKRNTTINGNNVLTAGFWVSIASLLTSIAILIVK